MKILIVAVVGFILLYGIAGFLILPVYVKPAMENFVRKNTGLTLQIEKLEMNPFTLALNLSNTKLIDPENLPVSIIDHIYVNFDISGLLQRTLVIRNLDIHRSQMNVRYHGAGVTNLSPLISTPSAASGEELTLPAVNIKKVSLSHGSLQFSDTTKTPEHRIDMEQISFTASNISTHGEKSGSYTLTIGNAAGGKIQIAGGLDLSTLSSRGSFEFKDFDLRDLHPLINDPAAPGEADGRIHLNGEYVLSRTDKIFRLLLSKTQLDGKDILLQDLKTATVRAQHVGMDIDAEFFTGEASTGFVINTMAMNVDEMRIIDTSSGGPVEFILGDVELMISKLDAIPQHRGDFTFKTSVGQSGMVEGSGWLSLATPEIQSSFKVSGLDLEKLNPYLSYVTDLELRSGIITGELNAHYYTGSFVINGQIGGRDFVLVDKSGGEPVLKLDEMSATGVTLNGMPPALSIETVILNHPYVKIGIDPARNINLSSWFKPIRQKGKQAKGEVPEQAGAVTLVVDRIGIKDGSIDFSDFSLSPQFNIVMSDMAGTFTGLSLEKNRAVSMELNGRVNKFGSAGITGRLRPFNALRYSEVNMNLRNIDTSVLSPYAARFAGRQIESGKLNLDLKYLVNNGKLDGNHDIELVNLVLGKRVESPEAQDLPLDLAVALLKDNEGRINISIPVTGTLDDPKFNIRTVIAAAVGKLITGIVSAPFKILGSLVGGSGDKQMNTIPFDPGSAAITPPALEMITELSEALGKRPGLALRAVGSYDPDLDRDALARQQMRLHISLAAGLEQINPENPGPIAFSDPKIQEVLDEFALSRLGKEKLSQITESYREKATATGHGEITEDQEAYYERIFDSLVEAEEIPPESLERVAHYRAQSIVDQFERLGVEQGQIKTGGKIKTKKSKDRHISVDLKAEAAP